MASDASAANLLLDHVLTCKAMLSLMNHFEGLVAVDDARQSIIDLSKRRNNQIVDPETAKPFLEWLLKNASLGA